MVRDHLGPGAGEVPGKVGVKTTLDHTKPKSPRHFRPRLLPLSHFLFFSNFKFLTNAPMSDDDVHLHVTYASHFDMDDAFCACMRIAIAAGLENVPIGVVTTPGPQSPKPLASSSLADMDF